MENNEHSEQHERHHGHIEIFIDQTRHESPNPTTGEALYRLGEIPTGLELYREVRGDREDQPVPSESEPIHLTEFEHFHSDPAQAKEFTIIVNGRKRVVASEELTFDEVVAFAFNPVPSGPNIVITVTYRHGPLENPEGVLAKGERVWIKNGMVFNVKATDRS